jgi:hypothetical protein
LQFSAHLLAPAYPVVVARGLSSDATDGTVQAATAIINTGRQDGTFFRDDFYGHVGDVYSCRAGKMLTTTGSRVDGATLRWRAQTMAAKSAPSSLDSGPKEPPRAIYEGARDMARQIASLWQGRTARRLRKKVEMLRKHQRDRRKLVARDP